VKKFIAALLMSAFLLTSTVAIVGCGESAEEKKKREDKEKKDKEDKEKADKKTP